MSSTEISIKQLPQITEINDDDLILVQTTNATNTLKFGNFVVGLENTTFASTISANATNVDAISSVIRETFFVKNSTLDDGPDIVINGLSPTVSGVMDTFLLPIDITQGSNRRTFYFILSGGPFIV